MVDRFNTLIVDLFARLQLQREEGQGTVEYALILGLVVVGAIAALTTIGGSIKTTLDGFVTSLGG